MGLRTLPIASPGDRGGFRRGARPPVSGNPEPERAYERDTQPENDTQAAPAPYQSLDPDPVSSADSRPENCSCLPLAHSLRGECKHQPFNQTRSINDEHVEHNDIYAEGEDTQLVEQPVQSSNSVGQDDGPAHAAVPSTGHLVSDVGYSSPDSPFTNLWALNNDFGGEPDLPLPQSEPLSARGWPDLDDYPSTPALHHGYPSDAVETYQTSHSYQLGLPGPSQQHHLTSQTFSTNYASALGPTNTTPHNHHYYTNLGHSAAQPNEFVAGMSGWQTQPTYPTPPTNPSALPPWGSAGSTNEPDPNRAIVPSMITNTSTTPNSAGSAKPTTPKPRRTGGPKPANKTCSNCGMTFDRPYRLKDHMHTHTGVKRHTCRICNITCSSHSNLTRHLRNCRPGSKS